MVYQEVKNKMFFFTPDNKPAKDIIPYLTCSSDKAQVEKTYKNLSSILLAPHMEIFVKVYIFVQFPQISLDILLIKGAF